MRTQTNLLALSIQDFFSPQMLKYSILPFIFSILIMYSLFFLLASVGLNALGSMDVSSTQTTLENGIPHTEILQSVRKLPIA
jgi:hypothetical protein